MSIPTHDQYPGTNQVDFDATISVASLAVVFYDMCKEGQMASSTASLLTNTYIQALLLGRTTLDISDTPLDTGSS